MQVGARGGPTKGGAAGEGGGGEEVQVGVKGGPTGGWGSRGEERGG